MKTKAIFDGREFFGVPEIGEKYSVNVENEDKSHNNLTGTVVDLYPSGTARPRFARLWVRYQNGNGFHESFLIRPKEKPEAATCKRRELSHYKNARGRT